MYLPQDYHISTVEYPILRLPPARGSAGDRGPGGKRGESDASGDFDGQVAVRVDTDVRR